MALFLVMDGRRRLLPLLLLLRLGPEATPRTLARLAFTAAPPRFGAFPCFHISNSTTLETMSKSTGRNKDVDTDQMGMGTRFGFWLSGFFESRERNPPQPRDPFLLS